MRYYKLCKSVSSKPCEVTKEEARETLDGYWKSEMLDDIFDNEKSFRLFSAFSIVWTQAENGLIPMPGFYGVCE